MNQLISHFSFLLSILCYVEVEAQSSPDQSDQLPGNTASNFEPSLEGVIVLFVLMVILTIVIVLFAKFFHRTGVVLYNQQIPDELTRPVSRSSGIDKTVIESLPFFKFSALRGLRGGLECVVCLSKFEDIEILRLLPKCKHVFHINCVDQWLENHSSCPLCRQKISIDNLTYTNSLTFLSSHSEMRENSNVELFIQREDNRQESSRFSIGNSFRKCEKGVPNEDELPIREDCEGVAEIDKFLHKFNHKIMMSNAVLKSRWSNLSSSDLLFLNSEMLGDVSSNRFSALDSQTHANSNTWAAEEGGISRIKEEMEGEWDSHPLQSGANTPNPTRNLQPNRKRSMSEISVHSRFTKFSMRNNSVMESSVPENAAKEERLKRLWLPIARKTIQWYANRDKKSQQLNTRQSLNV